MKHTLVTLIGTAVAGSISVSAATIGWESWGGPDDIWEPTLLDGGLTGLAVGTVETGGVWFNHNNATVAYGASDDGTFGNLVSPAADATVALGEGISLANGYDGFIDFSVTNTTGVALDLQGFHFDSGAFRVRAAKDWSLDVLAGGNLTATVGLDGGTTTVATAPITDDWDVDLTVLADYTLDAGGFVTFRLNWTGGQAPETGSSGHNLMLDNVAITTNPVPEPSTMGLMAVCAVALLLRRSRSIS